VLSLFLGATAHALSSDDIARHVVRRTASLVTPDPRMRLPAVDEPRWLPAISDVDCLDRIVGLPPPVPPLDGDARGVLFT
jgi:hypothetical protein